MERIIIVGSGGIGRACGWMLLHHSENIRLFMADIDFNQCLEAITWIRKGLENREYAIHALHIQDQSLNEWNPAGDILLDCSPGALCFSVAKVALRNNMHYANLSENVPETRKIIELANRSQKGFVLQTGLAPGFVNILTRKMVLSFEETHPDVPILDVKMRVGALPICVSSPSFYAFTWSPAGVSTEYLNNSEVLKDGKVQFVQPLTSREEWYLDGKRYEADHTSGGSSDLPDYFQNKIRNLDYKTLRYPGHYSWIGQLKEKLGEQLNAKTLKKEMLKHIHFQDRDRVLVYVSVMGESISGNWIEKNYYLELDPLELKSITISAIQRTTASALAQTAELLMQGKIQGPVLQSKMPVDDFLSGQFVKKYYGRIAVN